jgi:hypothetical protein
MFSGMCRSPDSSMHAAPSDSDPDWMSVFENWSVDTGGPFNTNPAFSTGDSDYASDSKMVSIIAEVGDYCFGPLTERESVFAKRYEEQFWHARSWQLLPRNPFYGPIAGLKVDV